ncbi:MAG: thioredoxin family protein [Aureispira sp.]
MTLEEYQHVVKLNALAKDWIESYLKNELGNHSPRLKRQHKEMKILKTKTDRLMDRQAGEASGDENEQLGEIEKLAQPSPAFAQCFGPVQTEQAAKVGKATTVLALKLKKLTTNWFGQFADSSTNESGKALVASIHERAKELLAAPKTTDGDTISVVFYGSKSKRCRKMKRTIKFVEDEYDGLLNVEQHKVEDDEEAMHELGLENLPTLIFKRGDKKIATHQGILSVSALESKINILLEGANFTNSSSIKSISDMKSVNQKELYGMGEYLLFYFIASWCGTCKKTTPVIEEQARNYSKVKYESIQVDGSHKLHKSFGVTEVPALVFVHDGKVIGKHTGYITPSTLAKKLEDFAVANKRKISNTHSGEASTIEAEEVDQSSRKVKDKHKEE